MVREATSASEGACLTGEGAAGYSFFILAEGGAVVTSEGATVTTTSPAKLLVRFGGEFRRLQQEQPDRGSDAATPRSPQLSRAPYPQGNDA